MSKHCVNRPTGNAHWSCTKCSKLLCNDCVSIRDKGGYHVGEKLYFCPTCSIELPWLGVENIIAPFWNRLPKIFRYPFASQPLLLMIVLAVGGWLFNGAGRCREHVSQT